MDSRITSLYLSLKTISAASFSVRDLPAIIIKAAKYLESTMVSNEAGVQLRGRRGPSQIERAYLVVLVADHQLAMLHKGTIEKACKR